MLLFFILGLSCNTYSKTDSFDASEHVPLDIESVALELDLASLQGLAKMTLRSSREYVYLNSETLIIHSVSVDGTERRFLQDNGFLSFKPNTGHVDNIVEVEISYSFPERNPQQFDGWIPDLGLSFIWPDHCGNLYPCHPDTRDGIEFSVDVSGIPEGWVAIHAQDVVPEAPPYMPAIAIGDYTQMQVGTTTSGIEVLAWYLDGEAGATDAYLGVQNMVQSIDFMEETYGPYAFGDRIGTVEVNWGMDSYGGMEHHPFFHVGHMDFWNEETQIHEVAHGWFGNAVRLECWEDFVLSEGTVTYMTARTLEQVAGEDLWAYYVDYFLEPICQGGVNNTVVMPEGCNELDFENSSLWSLATYMKGACFYEELGDILSPEVLDSHISEFYNNYTYRSARMEDMIEHILMNSSPEQQERIEQSVFDWLQSSECPVDYANRCRFRNP